MPWNWSFRQLLVSNPVCVWEQNLSPLEEQSLLFTAEPSLQPLLMNHPPMAAEGSLQNISHKKGALGLRW